tara:strand:+ start:208 stop:507 length:300 start_codon:yes stop_codon:yes gene_type:complete
MSKETSIIDLSKIIVKAIEDEPYFSTEILIPKVKNLITGFRLKMESINYNSIENPTKTAKLIRSYQLQVEENKFWKNKLIEVVGGDINKYYKELDELNI